MQEITRLSQMIRVESFAASRMARTCAIRLQSPGPQRNKGFTRKAPFIKSICTDVALLRLCVVHTEPIVTFFVFATNKIDLDTSKDLFKMSPSRIRFPQHAQHEVLRDMAVKWIFPSKMEVLVKIL
jgi:hypothetical protein